MESFFQIPVKAQRVDEDIVFHYFDSPIPSPIPTDERVVKVKRPQDILFWEVCLPANCTYKKFAELITNKTGNKIRKILYAAHSYIISGIKNVTLVAKEDVRIGDDEDVQRLHSGQKLIVTDTE